MMLGCIVWRVSDSLLISVFFFKQKTAYEMRISDWSSDVCSSDLTPQGRATGVCASREAASRHDAADRPRRRQTAAGRQMGTTIRADYRPGGRHIPARP